MKILALCDIPKFNKKLCAIVVPLIDMVLKMPKRVFFHVNYLQRRNLPQLLALIEIFIAFSKKLLQFSDIFLPLKPKFQRETTFCIIYSTR
jgi:hypothetical protein